MVPEGRQVRQGVVLTGTFIVPSRLNANAFLFFSSPSLALPS